jgi:hypothetical protein
VQVPKVSITKGRVTDEDLQIKMRKFYDELERSRLETGLAGESRLITPTIKGEEKRRKIETRTAETEEQTESKTDRPRILTELDGDEKGLLADIYTNEISQVGERYARLGLNKYQGNKAQQALLERDLIKAVKLPSFEKRGYWGKTFELTENGRESVAALGYPIRDTETLRRGGIHHRHLIRLIARKLQGEGHQVAEEAPLGDGKTADLLVEGKVAIEVERSLDNTAANVKKNLAKGFSVIVVCCGEASKSQAERLLNEAGLLDHVTIVDAVELLRKPIQFACGERCS